MIIKLVIVGVKTVMVGQKYWCVKSTRKKLCNNTELGPNTVIRIFYRIVPRFCCSLNNTSIGKRIIVNLTDI